MPKVILDQAPVVEAGGEREAAACAPKSGRVGRTWIPTASLITPKKGQEIDVMQPILEVGLVAECYSSHSPSRAAILAVSLAPFNGSYMRLNR
jgi:hypothetical protein